MSNPDRDQETLELFIEESLDSLVRVEKILLAAEKGQVDAQALSVLFRHFHTVKGTSGFLSLPNTFAVAHAAEDLLSELRDGNLRQEPKLFALLLRVCDRLQSLITHIKAHDDEPPGDVSEMVAEIRSALAEGHAGDTASPTPPAAAARPAATPAKSEPVLTPKSVSPPRALSVVPPAPPSLPVAVSAAPPRDAATASSALAESTKEGSDGTIRVSVGLLDSLMNSIGELVLVRNQIVQMLRTDSGSSAAAQSAGQRLSITTTELQDQVMKTRMQPVGRVLERIPRMIRDLCAMTGKKAVCRTDGNGTEIDRALIEAIRDPVMHMVRNAVDHGLETPEERVRIGKEPVGRVYVRAMHEGGMVTIQISDDGKGMDPKKLREAALRKGVITPAEAERLSDRESLRLVFRPGFSTAAQVSEISGRGVGMDVVRTHVERAGGQVEIESVVGKGTTIRLKMPLTLAIIPALLIECGGQRFAIPQVNLVELVHLDSDAVRTKVEWIRGAPIYRLRGEVLPFVRLDATLGLVPDDAPLPTAEGLNVVVVAAGATRYGLVVDAVRDTEEIVVKPLSGSLRKLPCYTGATVLGDGGVALILEVAGVAKQAGVGHDARRDLESENDEKEQADSATEPHLVFETGSGAPCAIPLSLVERLENVRADSIESVGGSELLQYRGEIIPIIRPETVLPFGQAPSRQEQPLIVVDLGSTVGIGVSAILDVVELATAKSGPSRRHTRGRVVAFGRTTVLLDIPSILAELAPEAVSATKVDSTPRRAA